MTSFAERLPPRLVGRERELQMLHSAFRAARDGHSSLVLVSGEPGIGKSRLIEYTSWQLRGDGASVISARCDETDAPYAPFIVALREFGQAVPTLMDQAVEGLPSPELHHLLSLTEDAIDASIAPRVSLSGNEERERFFDAMVLLLLRLAEAQPTLLTFDDLHLADEPTIRLLRHVVRSMRHAPVLVVGTYRDTDLDPHHPLESAIVDLYRERLASRLPMRRLGLADVTELIAGELEVPSSQVDLLLAQAIQAEAEGVPFFAEELVMHLREEGLLRRGPVGWTLEESAAVLLPQSVRSVVGHRLSRLDADALETLGVAAVIGTEFSFDLLCKVMRNRSGATVHRIQRDVEAALERRLILEHPSQMVAERAAPYAFAHDQIRDVLYWNLSQIRRRLLHEAVAETIEASGGDRDPSQFVALAQHFGAGEDLVRAARYSRLAGQRALELHAFEDAAMRFEEAIDILETRASASDADETVLREYFDLLGLREKAFDELGERDKQRRDLGQMQELTRRLGDRARLVVALRQARFDVLVGDRSEAVEYASKALELARNAGDRSDRMVAAARLGEAHAGRLIGEPSRLDAEPDALVAASRAYRAALELAEESGDGLWQPRLAQEIGVVDWELAADSDLEGKAAARVWLLDALDRWRTVGDARGEITALIALAYRRSYESEAAGVPQLERGFVGFLEEIRRLRTEERHLVRESLKPRTQALALLSVHVHCREFGVYQIALERGLEALAWSGRARDPRIEFYCLGGLSETELELGRPTRALEYAERAATIVAGGEAQVPAQRVHKWIGLACEGVGDLERAERHLRTYVAAAEARGLATEIAEADMTLAWFLASAHDGSCDAEVLDLTSRVIDLSAALPGSVPWGVEAFMAQSRLFRRRGDIPSAVATATAASSRMRQREISLRRLKVAVPFVQYGALAAAGHQEDALGALARAAEELNRVSSWIADLELRRSYLEEVELNREIHAAAIRWRVWPAAVVSKPAPNLPAPLTRRETEVLRLVSAGKTNRDIADVLFISEKTVARHLTNIFNKLNCQSRTQAAAYAFRQGIA